MKKPKVLFAFGTRPEAIKLAPVWRECIGRPDDLETIVCVTGQHREMLDDALQYFGIEPQIDLHVMSPGQSLTNLTGRCLRGLGNVLHYYGPDCVIGQGDTTTAMAAAMAAFHARIPFVHVEAGLRSGDMYNPWPEEFNRSLIGSIATLHCAPTERAAGNLRSAACTSASVHVVGNTAIDALVWTLERERERGSLCESSFGGLDDRRLVLVTSHRRESFGQGIERIAKAVLNLAHRFPDLAFVYPVHPNPAVQRTVREFLVKVRNVCLTPPLPYPQFVWLMGRSTLILTDSGGIQEEAPSLKKPVLVLRNVTERPEAIEAGAAELVGTKSSRIVRRASELLTDPIAYQAMQIEKNPYGDGHAAERIVELLLKTDWHSRALHPRDASKASRSVGQRLDSPYTNGKGQP